MREAALESLGDLYEVVERLRAPGGCPWDREQTHQSLRPYLLEEAYEALEAIESGSMAPLQEELGDLLLQVFMHAVIAQEDGVRGFDIGDVAAGAREKMVGRHPHVFGGVEASDAAQVVVNWERLKAQEKHERLSLLDGVPRSLPALALALAVQKRPARVGFDLTPTLPDALAEVGRTLNAAEHAARDAEGSGRSSPAGRPTISDLEEVVGNLLFAAVALARRLRVDPEGALRRRSRRFSDEFGELEARVRSGGGDVHATSPEEWTRRWHGSRST